MATARAARPRRARTRTMRVGSTDTVETDARRYDWRDPYHALLTLGWGGFLAAVLGYYLAVNIVFGALYLLQPGGVANLRPGAALGAFFFSVETFATVGYGVMAPQSLYAHGVATVEIFVGLLSSAVITGLMFVRFARPRPSLVFSRALAVAPMDGVPTLMLRVGNTRSTLLLQVEARLTLIVRHVTQEGHVVYRALNLPLLRAQGQVLALSWTLMHAIDAASPLHGMTTERLDALDASFVVSVTGTDQTLAAAVTATQDYLPSAVMWGHRFADMMRTDADGRAHITLARLHDVVPA